MGGVQPTSGIRTRISLQGGGRLDQVIEIVRVHLDPGEIRWEHAGGHQFIVSGEVRAYLYFVRRGAQEVVGEGLRIPFSRRVEAPGLGGGPITLSVEDAQSKYDYDPLTGEFQHRITLLLNLSAADARLGSAQGETRMSQVRVGPEYDAPVATDHPDTPSHGDLIGAHSPPEKSHTNDERDQAAAGSVRADGESARSYAEANRVGGESARSYAPADRVDDDKGLADAESHRAAEAPAPTAAADSHQGDPVTAPAEKAAATKRANEESSLNQPAPRPEKVIVWKPFPPPIE